MRDRQDEPTWVYDMSDAEGASLYVGITGQIKQRLWAHRNQQPWWSEVYAVHAALYPTRAEAAAWEAMSVPSTRYNVARPRRRPLPPVRHPFDNTIDFRQFLVGVDL